jgi:hypothetical protein
MWEDAQSESAESDEPKRSPVVQIDEQSLGYHQCEVGDTLTFKVVSKDGGQVGLQMEGPGDESEMAGASDSQQGGDQTASY